jgi:hypothetical protein
VQLVLFLIAIVLASAINIMVWRRLRRVTVGDAPAPWRRFAAYLGILTNSLAYAIPAGHLMMTSILLSGHRILYAPHTFDVVLVARVSVALGLLTVVLGAISPKKVGVQLMFSALILFSFWLPVGSLEYFS